MSLRNIKKSIKNIHDQGLSLLEVLLAIAIMAIFVIISINYYSSVRMAQKTNYFIEQLSRISTGTVNYIASNPTTDLSQVFTPKGQNMTNSLIKHGVITQADAHNAWEPANMYSIQVRPADYIGDSGYGPCLVIEVDLQLPSGFNPATQKGKPRLEALRHKIQDAFGQQNLKNQNASTVSIYAQGSYLYVQFCAQ